MRRPDKVKKASRLQVINDINFPHSIIGFTQCNEKIILV